jgi:hypothetical protein
MATVPPTTDTPVAEPVTGSSRRRSLLAGAAFFLLAAISTGSWLWLHRWYGLYEHRTYPRYSFERVVGGFDSPILRQTLAIFLLICAAYAAAILLVRLGRPSSRLALPGILALVAGPAAVNVFLYPVGALDVFNYLIELKLAFHYDENPYLVTFRPYEADSYAAHAFLFDVTLFYGPAWLLMTAIPAVLAGFDDVLRTVVALKVFNLLLIGLTAGAIAWYHHDRQARWLAVTMFAASPLVLFEGVGNGHNDVLLTTFVVGAMLALQRKSPLAGPLLALSALVKLYTVALVPIFIVVAIRERWGWRRIVLAVALTALTVVATSGPFWGDGKLVDGLRAGLEESQEMDHVSPLSLARQYVQEQEAQQRQDPELARSRPSFEIVAQEIQDDIDRGFTIVFVVGALALAATVWKGRPPALAAAETLLLLYLLMTNLYGWYLIPVIALLALYPDRLSRVYVVVAATLGLAYYPMFVWGHYNSGWSRFEIHQFLALFLTAPILLYLLARAVTWRRVAIAPRWFPQRPGAGPELDAHGEPA